MEGVDLIRYYLALPKDCEIFEVDEQYVGVKSDIDLSDEELCVSSVEDDGETIYVFEIDSEFRKIINGDYNSLLDITKKNMIRYNKELNFILYPTKEKSKNNSQASELFNSLLVDSNERHRLELLNAFISINKNVISKPKLKKYKENV